MKVYIAPRFRGEDQGDGGIRRVVEAQWEHLPQFGIEPVNQVEGADLLALHAGMLSDSGVPIVAHNHGLYWVAEEEWPYWGWKVNRDVIEVMRRAQAVTAPSEWVAQSLRRGMLLDPVVIPHGIDTEEWQPPAEPGAYVLWNKTRVDPVCDPGPVIKLAERVSTPFVSTFGDARPNVQVIGRVSHEAMKSWVQNAGVYLATPRETFGIGTLEAMACGVPILGWRWGGQIDLVRHEETGYLAKPGDYDDLEHGLQFCLEHRERLGAAARELAKQFTWASACSQYADLYKSVLAADVERQAAPRTSIVVPCYNHARWLTECVESVMAQTDRDLEVVIVDDCSPDDAAHIAADLCKRDPRVRYVKTPRNLYLAGARNYGISHARGRYILPLDADDMLPPAAVELLAGALAADPGIHIAYGHMEVIEEDGSQTRYDWPSRMGFNWREQMVGHNQLPYASMYRREVWERTGGYRTRVRTAEDADFWCRVTSYGFAARKITEAPTLLKRDHKDSMGYTEPEPAWRDWFGWSRAVEAAPFGSVGPPPQGKLAWPVLSHEQPKVSVIIPVGPGHEEMARTALDSLVAQGYPHWEAIVVDDTGGPDLDLGGFPWVHLVRLDGKRGPSAARNAGLAVAQASAICFLDADDYLQPDFLAETMAAFADCDEIIYTDWIALHADGTSEVYQVSPITSNEVLGRQQFAVTALYPAEALRKIGGFDETITNGWEDWDVHIALRTLGYCGERIPRALLTYRIHTGSLRERAFANKDALREQVLQKWRPYYDGREQLMPCAGCGSRRVASRAAQQNQAGGGNVISGEVKLVQYSGSQMGKFQVRGRATGKTYTFGRDGHHERMYVHADDVTHLIGLNGFSVVEPVQGTGSPDAEPIVAHQVGAAPAPEPPPGDPIAAASEPPSGGDEESTDAAANFDPSGMTASQIVKISESLGGRGLREMLELERAGKARKTAIAALEKALAVPVG